MTYSIRILFILGILFSTNCDNLCNNPSEHSQKESFSTVLCHPGDSILDGNFCVKCLNPQRNEVPTTNCTNEWNDSHVFRDRKRKSADSELITCLSSELEQKRFNIQRGADYLKGRVIRVVTVQRSPFVKLVDGKYTGVCFEFVYAIQQKYNFSTQIFPPYDGNWGAEMPNGSWNGMVGQVLRREADIGVAGFSVTAQRAKVIAFTGSYHQEPTGILIPPPTEGEKLSVLIRPLSFEVWMFVGLTITTLVPTLYTLHILRLRLSGQKNTKSLGQLCGELLHFMIGSLVQESVISPVNETTKFLIFLWWLLTLVVANIYVAYLVSYLSAPKLFNVVDSLEDLVAQHQIKWTFRLHTAHESLFKSKTSSGVYKMVGDGVSKDDLVDNDNAAVQRVLTGKYAFIKELSYLDVALAEDFVKSHECRMTLAKQSFFKVETALIVQKQCIFLKLINYENSVTVATGLMEKWKRIHWPREIWCNDAATYISSTRPKTRKLRLEDVQGAYFIFTCGIILSILTFTWEVMKNRLCICFRRAARVKGSIFMK